MLSSDRQPVVNHFRLILVARQPATRRGSGHNCETDETGENFTGTNFNSVPLQKGINRFLTGLTGLTGLPIFLLFPRNQPARSLTNQVSHYS